MLETSHNDAGIGSPRRCRPICRVLTAAVCVGALVAAGGSIAGATTVPDDTTAGSSAPAAAPTEVAVTLTDTAIEGLPAELPAGIVDVTVTDETEASGGDVSFTLVEAGTDAEMFKTDLTESIFTGGPIPDYFVNNAGIIEHGMITLDAGDYIVWIDLASNLDRPSTAEDIVTANLTVGPGDNDAVIPEQDSGSIRAGDYLFDVEVVAGGSSAVFTNSSDNQLHHVLIVDFGTNDPAVVEENLPALLASEDDSAMPEGIDPSQINFEFAGPGVFGPGGSGTFDAAFEPGRTYAAICFISDREGGLPHAIQHNMYDVFQVA